MPFKENLYSKRITRRNVSLWCMKLLEFQRSDGFWDWSFRTQCVMPNLGAALVSLVDSVDKKFGTWIHGWSIGHFILNTTRLDTCAMQRPAIRMCSFMPQESKKASSYTNQRAINQCCPSDGKTIRCCLHNWRESIILVSRPYQTIYVRLRLVDSKGAPCVLRKTITPFQYQRPLPYHHSSPNRLTFI